MVKKAYIGLMFVIVLLVFGTAAFMYNGSTQTNPGTQPGPENNSTMPVALTTGEPVSAMGALKIADDSPIVRAWKLNQTNPGIESISSEACDSGVAGMWTIVYAGNTDKVSVQVNGGKVDLTPLASAHTPDTLNVSGVIDSDRAFSIAAELIRQGGYSPTGPASVELYSAPDHRGIWDLMYPVEGSYFIVRLDANNGSVVTKTLIGSNSGQNHIIRPGP